MRVFDYVCTYVCLGFNIWCHNLLRLCLFYSSSGTLTSVLPHRNAMPQTHDMTPLPVTVYRHGAELLMCSQWMWKVTMEYISPHLIVFGQIRPGNPSPTFYTPANAKIYDAVMVVVSQKLRRKCAVPAESWTRALWSANPLRYPLVHGCFLMRVSVYNSY